MNSALLSKMGSSWSDIRNFDKNSPNASALPIRVQLPIMPSNRNFNLAKPFDSGYTDSSIGRSTAIKLPTSTQGGSNDSISNSSIFTIKTDTTLFISNHSGDASLNKWPTFKNINSVTQNKAQPISAKPIKYTPEVSKSVNSSVNLKTDKNVVIIHKKPTEKLNYTQKISLRYL